jgi:K+-transporting ATPase KdpF subunit
METVKKSFVLLVTTSPIQGSFVNGSIGYIVGGIIAVVIMGYLVYSLLKPEKF